MTITPVTPAKFAALKAKLENTHQAEVTGDLSGTITGHGVVANYQYDGAVALTVDVIHHPFYVPVSAIEHQLRDAVAAA